MSMIIKRVWNRTEFLINQGQVQYHEPEEFEQVFNDACDDIVSQLVKDYKRTGIMPQDLQKVVKTITLGTSGNSGVADLPSDFIVHVDATGLPVDAPTNEVEFPAPHEWAGRVKSKARPPEADHPIAKIEDGKITVAPQMDIRLTYVSLPVRAVLGYTYASDGRSIVFNEATSVDTNLPDHLLTEIMTKVITYFGIKQKDPLLAQTDQLIQQNNKQPMI